MRLLRLLCLLWVLLPPGAAWAQPSVPQISLVTFSPGNIYWQRFGHNALLVREAGRPPLLYNYGVFDFEQKNFFLNFARGRMLYQLDYGPLDRALYGYAREGRWALEQRLDLNPAQAQEMVRFLHWNALPQNAAYRYDYFADNCSTRVRDVLDHVLGGTLRTQLEPKPAGVSLRFEATRLIAPHLALALGMDLGMGPRADEPLDLWRQSFVPMVLMDAVRAARNGDRPLVSAEQWLIEAPARAPPDAPRNFLPVFVLLGLGLALLLCAPGRAAARGAAVLAGVMSLSGLILALGWVATEHWVMEANRNLLLLNPLWALLVPALWRQQQPTVLWARALVWMLALAALLAAVLALLPQPVQQQLQWAVLWLPLNLVLAWRLGAWRRGG